MDSKTNNSLIDFDNFDPFAPTPQKVSHFDSVEEVK